MKKFLIVLMAAILAMPVCVFAQEEAKAPAKKTFSVYADKRSPDNHYIPSGWMGDYGDIKLTEAGFRAGLNVYYLIHNRGLEIINLLGFGCKAIDFNGQDYFTTTWESANCRCGCSGYSTHTENIGQGGICAVLKKSLSKFVPVELALYLENGELPICCDARVVWVVKSKSNYDTGIEFINLKAKDAKRIERIVEECLKKQESSRP